MSFFSEKSLIYGGLGLVAALTITGLWSLFVWANNRYAIRRGGSLLKYNFWRLSFISIFVVLVQTIMHSLRK